MATIIELNNLRDGYVDLVERVLHDGCEVAPRGIKTRELRNVVIVLTNPRDAVPIDVNRNLNMRIGAAETASLLGGVSDAQMMMNITPNFAQFVEHGRLRGAYGPRARRQWVNVIERLVTDPDTRQASIQIFREDDLAVPTADVPCTLALSYFIRDNRLDAITTMRSNDLAWGVPYDFWVFTMAQRAVAQVLGLEVGTYTHYTSSLHCYTERDADLFSRLHRNHDQSQTAPPPPFLETRLSRPDVMNARTRWTRIRNRMEYAVGAKPTRNGATEKASAYYDSNSRWYADLLRPVRSGLPFCVRCHNAVQPDEFNARWLWRCFQCRINAKYGFAPGEYDLLVVRQDSKCPICLNTLDNDAVVDHDHATGQIRGVLHRGCNAALGLFHDNPKRMEQAITYLAGKK